MVKRAKLSDRIKGVDNQILLKLYDQFADLEADSGSLDSDGIYELLPHLKARFIDVALEVLIEKEYIYEGDGWDKTYTISREGRNIVETWNDDEVSAIEVGNKIIVSASDRIVTLDHNSKPYEEVVGALKDLHETIRSKNDFTISDEDKALCLQEIEAIESVLGRTEIEVSRYNDFIEPKLEWIAKVYNDPTIMGKISVVLGVIGILLTVII